MNFVFVGSSPRAWGSEQHFIGLAKACQEAGHRVIAVVRAGSEVACLMNQAGIDVRAVPFRGGEDPRAMYAAFKAIREIRADWIVTAHKKHYWPLYLLARMTRTRLAVFRHLVYVNDWATRVVFPRLVDRFFVVSDFALETLVQAGAPRERLTRLYNQIDLRQFRPDPEARAQTRAELELPSNALVVGFVGRHEIGKGVHILREALNLAMEVHPNLYALWVGSGPEWLATKAMLRAGAHHRRHRFVVWTRAPEQMYAALDCLVAPSVAPETFGRVVAEAQACGVPVIASAAGGMAEVFAAGQGGEVLSQLDPAVLAEKILRLVDDENRRQVMARLGRQFVRRFDSAVIVRQFIGHLSTAGHKASVVTSRAIPSTDAPDEFQSMLMDAAEEEVAAKADRGGLNLGRNTAASTRL